MSGAKFMLVFGTRPEAIKLTPVYFALKEANADVEVCSTGQHSELLDGVLKVFDIHPDHEIDAMRPNQNLNLLTARILEKLCVIYQARRPDWVIVQGDATSALAGAMAAYYEGVKVAHVEAGLTTGDLDDPYPEEGNRQMITQIARLHFAPTDWAKANLYEMGASGGVHVTGNTVIDALELMPDAPGKPESRYVLITTHRRENYGDPLVQICAAVKELARDHLDTDFVYSVHPNPSVSNVVHKLLGDAVNVGLINPPDYPAWIDYLRNAYFVMSDSGGIQEEAPSFGVPVLVLRKKTERPEAVYRGYSKLVGTDRKHIVEEAGRLLDHEQLRHKMSAKENPYGDGKAAHRIAEILANQE